MASIPEKYVTLIQAAAKDIQSLLKAETEVDIKVVQKGLLLFRQGLVTKAKLENGMIIATVQDVTPVNLKVDLSFLQISSCSCPSEGFCRHQMAAFFLAYSKVGSVSQWVEEWKQPIREKKSVQIWGVQKAKDLLNPTGPIHPDYDQWVKSFNRIFETIMQSQKSIKPYLVPELFNVYTRQLKALTPAREEWRQLYQLIGAVHSFRNLSRFTAKRRFQETQINRYYREIFYQLIGEIEELAKRLNVHALPFSFDAFLKKLMADTQKLLLDESVLEFEQTLLYLTLWTHLFSKKDWHEEELNQLKILSQSNKNLPLLIGYIHQNIMLKKDEEAIKLLKVLQEEATPYFLFWFEIFEDRKEWVRMEPFVEVFVSHLKNYSNRLYDAFAREDFTRVVIGAVSSYSLKTQRFDLYERALVQTLPYSYAAYENFLFSQKYYEKWCDFQIYADNSIASISKEKIKILQEEDPGLLLPLYHQSIIKYIEMKNRSSYREAVKQLKKLRTIYKKLKRKDDWDHYFDLLLEKYKRLRAFREECQRSKLLPAD